METQQLSELISKRISDDDKILEKIKCIFSSIKYGNGQKDRLIKKYNEKIEKEEIKISDIEKIIKSLEQIAKRLLGCTIFLCNDLAKYYVIHMIEIYADCLLDDKGDYIHYFNTKSKNPKFRMKCFKGPFLYFYGGRIDIKIWDEYIPVSFLIRKLFEVNKDLTIKKNSIRKDNGVLYEVYQKLLGINDKKTEIGNYKYIEKILENNSTKDCLIILNDNYDKRNKYEKNKYILCDTHEKFINDESKIKPQKRVFSGKPTDSPVFLIENNFKKGDLKWNFSFDI